MAFQHVSMGLTLHLFHSVIHNSFKLSPAYCFSLSSLYIRPKRTNKYELPVVSYHSSISCQNSPLYATVVALNAALPLYQVSTHLNVMQLVLQSVLRNYYRSAYLRYMHTTGGLQPEPSVMVRETCKYQDEEGRICGLAVDFDISPFLQDGPAWCESCIAKATARRQEILREITSMSYPRGRFASLRSQRTSSGRSQSYTSLEENDTGSDQRHVSKKKKRVRWKDEIESLGLATSTQHARSSARHRTALPQPHPGAIRHRRLSATVQELMLVVWLFSYLGLALMFCKMFVHYTMELRQIGFMEASL